jgi:hypothetical protein
MKMAGKKKGDGEESEEFKEPGSEM